MKTTVIIQNLSCDSCKNALEIKLSHMEGVSKVDINVAKKSLTFDYTTHNVIEGLRSELRDMGYPITEDPSTF